MGERPKGPGKSGLSFLALLGRFWREALGKEALQRALDAQRSTLEKTNQPCPEFGLRDQDWSRAELFQVPGLSRCYSTPGCGTAGERAGSTCAIDVEGLKRRPPLKVGGLCHEFRV